MCLKVCRRLFRTVMINSRIVLLAFLKRVLKVSISQLLCLVLIFLFTIVVWIWAPNGKSVLTKPTTNPVILWWTEGFPGTSETKYCPNSLKCDIYSVKNLSEHVHAYLFYGSNIKFDDLPVPRRPNEIIWGLYHEESPRNVEELMHEPVLKLFNFTSTFSRYSDVPFALQYLDSPDDITSRKHFVDTRTKNLHLKQIAPILYLQSDCETSTERDLYVIELMKLIQIDSYGSCLNNKKLPEQFTHDYLNQLNEDNFLNFVARYKFVIAIENGVCDDYVTEKFWRAIKVGTVPIYYGCPFIKDWLPNNKSAILLEDYPTPKILNDHLGKLLNNDIMYEQYLEHKTKQIVTNSRLIKEFNERPYQFDSLKTVNKFECFVCEKIHERIQGTFEISIVSKSHYSCPKPLSALQLDVNPKNSWVHSWDYKKEKADKIYKSIMSV